MPSTGPKRSVAQRERDLALIAEMSLQNKSAQTIADKLNARVNAAKSGITYTLTRQTVRKDILENQKRYAERAGVATAVRIGEHYARLVKLEQVYYGAWDRSKEDATKKSSRVSGSPTEVGSVVKIDDSETRVGDPVFLAGVERQHAAMSNLFALNAPTKIALTDASGREDAPVTNEATSGVLADLVRKLGYLVTDDECEQSPDQP